MIAMGRKLIPVLNDISIVMSEVPWDETIIDFYNSIRKDQYITGRNKIESRWYENQIATIMIPMTRILPMWLCVLLNWRRDVYYYYW